MDFRTIVSIPKERMIQILPCEKMLFVGSCFAVNMGQRFLQEQFQAVVNPFGVMYNPASILHSIQRLSVEVIPNVTVLTLGTNHVYVLKATDEIVDNCAKRPQSLFREEELTVEMCADYMTQAIQQLRQRNNQVKVILTVSPIRYAKYGFHGSQLSKATLLLAVERVVKTLHSKESPVCYFPAYEIVNDELRDYRFYQEDMLHPSSQAVEYIYQRFADTYFSKETFQFLQEWKPIKEALGHRPFHPESVEYHDFVEKIMQKIQVLAVKYPHINTETITELVCFSKKDLENPEKVQKDKDVYQGFLQRAFAERTVGKGDIKDYKCIRQQVEDSIAVVKIAVVSTTENHPQRSATDR